MVMNPTWRDPWPPPERDPVDIALLAARILIVAGQLRGAVRRAAREAGLAPDLAAFLLLFAERNRRLCIVDIADELGIGMATASRLAAKAHRARLIDKCGTIDGRAVTCRLTLTGRELTLRGLDALRADVAEVLRRSDREWIRAAQTLLAPSERLGNRLRSNGHRAGVLAGMWPSE